MKKIYKILFFIVHKIFVPYRLERSELLFRKFKNSIAKHIFENIGTNANIRPGSKISYMENVSLGKNSSIGDRSVIVASEIVKIGDDVMMGPEVMIFTQNHEILPKSQRLIHGKVEKKAVIIEDDVWIGARVIILPGAIIHRGTVIAAGCVVPGKEFPEYSVIGGNPAKIIKYRI